MRISIRRMFGHSFVVGVMMTGEFLGCEVKDDRHVDLWFVCLFVCLMGRIFEYLLFARTYSIVQFLYRS